MRIDAGIMIGQVTLCSLKLLNFTTSGMPLQYIGVYPSITSITVHPGLGLY